MKIKFISFIFLFIFSLVAETKKGYLWERIETGVYDDSNIPDGQASWITIYQEIVSPSKTPVSLRYSGNDSILLGFEDGELWKWDLNKSQIIWQTQIMPDKKNQSEFISSPVVNTDFKYAAILSGLTVKVINIENGSLVSEFGNLKTPDQACANIDLVAADVNFDNENNLITRFSISSQANRDGCLIADKNYLIKWNLKTGKQLWRYQLQIPVCANDEPNWCMVPSPVFSISPKSNLLAGASCDGSIFFLDTVKGKELKRRSCPVEENPSIYEEYPSLNGSPMAMLWSKDGKDLYAAFSPASSSDVNLVKYSNANSPPGKSQFLVDMNGSAPKMKINSKGDLIFINTGDFRILNLKTGKQEYLSLAFSDFDMNPAKQEIATLSGQGFFLRHKKKPVTIKAGSWTKTGLYFSNTQDLIIRAKGEITIGFGENKYTGDTRSDVLYLNAIRGEGPSGEKSGELILNIKPSGTAIVYGGKSREESLSPEVLRASLPNWQ